MTATLADCGECGARVSAVEKHAFVDCVRHRYQTGIHRNAEQMRQDIGALLYEIDALSAGKPREESLAKATRRRAVARAS